MTSQIIPVETFDLIVFGATGDLAKRKLIPALYHRHCDAQIAEDSRIIAVSRSYSTSNEYKNEAHKALKTYLSEQEYKIDRIKTFLQRLTYISINIVENTGWSELTKKLSQSDDRVRAFYLAVAPELYGPICEQIHQNNLITDKTRLVIEKPIGKDLASARQLNHSIGNVFRENQIYRIDHYLGKETVQNLMALRFANALFEPIWNSAHIDHVQITVAESIGVGTRGSYYDTSGALRDMVQNHLLQLLCLVAMEPPMTMDADAVRDEKLKVLQALEPITQQNIDLLTVRGQYAKGASNEGSVAGYLEELGNHSSLTETFVAMKINISNWRWASVPFYLRTGKRLPRRSSEIVISFRPIPHSIFGHDAGQISENRLVIRLQPNEGVKLWLMIKDPGPGGMRLRHVPLDMSFAKAFKIRSPDAYERLIMDVIRGNATLFMRRDEVEAAWAWIDPILAAWADKETPPKKYTAGTWGPAASIALIERDGRTWHENDE